MEGLGLVDYGSDLDDDARSSGSSGPAAQLGSTGARAVAVHELEHLDPAAAADTAPIPPPAVSTLGRFEGEDGNSCVSDTAAHLNLEVAPPGVVAAPLQDAVKKYLKMRCDLGVEVKAVIGMSRDFRNPYFLQKWVHDANINERGSSMPPQCFDPLSLHEEDFYEKLQKAWEAKKACQEVRKKAINSGTKSGAASRAAPPVKQGDVQAVVDNARARAQIDIAKRHQLGSRGPK